MISTYRLLYRNKIFQKQIISEAANRGVDEAVVEEEAKQILLTMAHQMHPLSVRFVGYAVVKVIKVVFLVFGN